MVIIFGGKITVIILACGR